MHDSSSLFEMEFGAGLEPAYSGFAVHLLANRTPELKIWSNLQSSFGLPPFNPLTSRGEKNAYRHKLYVIFVAQCQALLFMFNGEEFLQCG